MPRWLWQPGAVLMSFIYFVYHEFIRNKCLRSAAALTYATIFAMFPLLALISIVVPAFFGGAEELQNRVMTFIQSVIIPPTKTYFFEGPTHFIERPGESDNIVPAMGPPAPMSEDVPAAPRMQESDQYPLNLNQELINQVNTYIANFQQYYVAIGFLGALGFLIVCTILYINVERNLNDIWKIPRHPNFVQMFSRFVIILTCAPLFLGASFTLTALITARFGVKESLLSSILAYPIISIFFTLAYYILPRIDVKFRAALLGGVIAGGFWEGAKAMFGFYLVSPQVTVLFRSVGAIPVMLLWFYYSWAIFLLGGQISYVMQNFKRLRRDRAENTLPHLDYRWVLTVAALVAQEFQKGTGGITASRLEELLPIARVEIDRIVEYLTGLKGFGQNLRGRIILEQPPTLITLESFLGPLMDLDLPEEAIKPTAGDVPALPVMGLDRIDWLRSHLDHLHGWAKGRTVQDLL